MPLGSADEQKPAVEGTVEAWGRSSKNPVGGWYGIKKGLRGRFANYVPPILEALGLAEVEHKKKKSIVTVLAERDTTMDFTRTGAAISADHPQLSMFVRELREMMKQHKVSTENISFALPPDPLFINIIPG